ERILVNRDSPQKLIRSKMCSKSIGQSQLSRQKSTIGTGTQYPYRHIHTFSWQCSHFSMFIFYAEIGLQLLNMGLKIIWGIYRPIPNNHCGERISARCPP